MKPRSDSTPFPPEVEKALFQWLFRENLGYDAVQARLLAEHKLEASLGVLSNWYKQHAIDWRLERALERITTGVTKADAVQAELSANAAKLFDATKALMGQAAFDRALEGGKELSVDDIGSLLEMSIHAERSEAKRVDQALKREDQLLARQRFQRETCELFLRWAEDQRAKEVVASEGGNESKIERLGQLMFGPVWEGEGKAEG